MTMRALVRVSVAVMVLGIAAVARATHVDPGVKAKSIVGDLIMAYEPCTMPDTLTDSGFAACSTPVRSDPTCGFGPSGKGRLKIRTSGTFIRVGFKLTGLSAGCENTVMGVLFRWRVTGDQCGGSSCTLDETDYMPGYGACIVTGGTCILRGVGPLPMLSSEAHTGIELIGADIVRNGTLHTFRMGLFSR